MVRIERICGATLAMGFVLAVCLGVGYVMNVYKFTQLDFKAPVKAEVIRGIGLFPPLGAIIGWIPIKDGLPILKAGHRK